MIRVLHVIGNMDAGGMENMIMNYYRKIDKNLLQFDFLIFGSNKCFYEDEIIKYGGKIFRITSRRRNFIKNKIEIKNFFKTHNYSIVEFHQGITYYFPLKTAKRYKVENRIIHNHGINRNFLKFYKLYNELWAKKRICNLANNYFSCSEMVFNHLFTKKIIKNGKINIINNAIDISKFKFSQINRDAIREELNINKEVLIGHIGTFTTPKNHKFIIEIFKKLFESNKNYKLLLIGKGPLKDEIFNKIKEYHLDKSVIYFESRRDIDKIMSALDILLFPSLYEGIPLTLIEAQSSGLPIIASNKIDNNTFVVDDIIKQIDLNDSIDKWINAIINTNISSSRQVYYEKMYESKFNIVNEVKYLQNLYIKIHKNK